MTGKKRNWAAWLGGGAALFTMMSFIGVWASGASEKIHWEDEAIQARKEIDAQHNGDTQQIYQFLADQEKSSRIRKNHELLLQLQRDYLGHRYSSPEEKELLENSMKSLEAALRCDEEGICIQ